MSLICENSEELIVIYYHRFDAVSGLYAQSTPIGVCAENDLPGALKEADDDIHHENYLLEVVAFTELAPEDQLRIVEQFSHPEILVRQVIPNACEREVELPTYG